MLHWGYTLDLDYVLVFGLDCMMVMVKVNMQELGLVYSFLLAEVLDCS